MSDASNVPAKNSGLYEAGRMDTDGSEGDNADDDSRHDAVADASEVCQSLDHRGQQR